MILTKKLNIPILESLVVADQLPGAIIRFIFEFGDPASVLAPPFYSNNPSTLK